MVRQPHMGAPALACAASCADVRCFSAASLLFSVARTGHDDDDEDEEDGAPAGAKPSPFDIGGSSDEDNEDSGQSTPHARVAPAAGAPKPLPPPPPPKQLVAKVVEWRGVGAGTVRETRRLFALCCPCLNKTDEFQPLQ